jgi:hypothetical protein
MCESAGSNAISTAGTSLIFDIAAFRPADHFRKRPAISLGETPRGHKYKSTRRGTVSGQRQTRIKSRYHSDGSRVAMAL